jgi:diacylglycerol kinase (ATP)
MAKSFSIVDRLKSFTFAFHGIAAILRSQHNAWLHFAATIVVIVAGAWFQIARGEWVWLILAIVVVWMAEALNTAFEFLCDVASPEFHPLVKQAKDVAAAAVLIAALGATIIGVLVFAPYVSALL